MGNFIERLMKRFTSTKQQEVTAKSTSSKSLNAFSSYSGKNSKVEGGFREGELWGAGDHGGNGLITVHISSEGMKTWHEQLYKVIPTYGLDQSDNFPSLCLMIPQNVFKKMDLKTDEGHPIIEIDELKKLIADNNQRWCLYVDDTRIPNERTSPDIIIFARTNHAAVEAINLFGSPSFMDLDFYLHLDQDITYFIHWYTAWVAQDPTSRLREDMAFQGHSSDPDCNVLIWQMLSVLYDPFSITDK